MKHLLDAIRTMSLPPIAINWHAFTDREQAALSEYYVATAPLGRWEDSWGDDA